MNEILLYTQDESTRKQMSGIFADSRYTVVPTGGRFQDLSDFLASGMIPAALVDVDGAPESLINDLALLTNSYTQTRFILLTSSLSDGLVMKAMQVGARHVQVKSSAGDELRAVLDRLLSQGGGIGGDRGRWVTVMSAGGGCGATTIAVNLAEEYTRATAKRALLIDLDYHYAAISHYLEARGLYGIADVLGHGSSPDPELIQTTAHHYSDQLDVLTSPAGGDLSRVGTIDADRLVEVGRVGQQVYGATVIDAPRPPFPVALALALASDVTLIVMQLMVKDIRVAYQMIQALTSNGVPEDRIQLVVNRFRAKEQVVTLTDLEKKLGHIETHRIQNDYKSASHGINFGKPLAESLPKSDLRKGLQELTVKAFGLKAAKQKRGFFGFGK